ncbi:DUF7342 family protein [Haloprofundus halophilus]|uniref:DUF7342 family protein n=1 Tax=Haloprofundus halophilus TaxID=2283527 RepID=UPI000E444891|nr:hypothetical protein [Haloprofundus halophilus]
MDEERPSEDGARGQWQKNRTTFQRVYDVLVGTYESGSAKEFAEWADCSENGAREALSQLVEMGIAEKTDTRPAGYRRNPSYFRWKRIEEIAGEYSASELRRRVDELIEEDRQFQDEYGVPSPDAVVEPDNVEPDHESVHERWDDLSEWRTVRRDISVLKQAVQRAESTHDDRAQA